MAENEYSDDWESADEAENQMLGENTAYSKDISENQHFPRPIIGPHLPRAADLCKSSMEYSLSMGTRRVPRDPTPIPLPLLSDYDARVDALLAVATPQTRISDIFHYLFSGPPPPP